MNRFFQRLGKAMLLAVIVMPIAGILLRIASEDLLNIPILGAAGNAVFGNLDILFAIGVAMGFVNAKDRGKPAMLAVVAILTLKEGLKVMNPDINMGIFGGIISGLVSAYCFDKFKEVKLPSALFFFAGENFPFLVVLLVQTLLALVFGFIWPVFQNGIDSFAQMLGSMGAIGVGLFVFFNRLLLPTGLHHVLNTYIYFEMGSFTNAAGEQVKGEIGRYIAQDPSAGYFLAPFFVIMMFAIPAISLAIYKASFKDQRENAKGLISSSAFTSFLTGITEPVEFMFMFASPTLYLIHAILAGIVGVISYLMNIRIGFAAGSGFIDYILNLGISTNGLKVLLLGIITFAVYYFVFYTFITKKDVKLIGRNENKVDYSEQNVEKESKASLKTSNYGYLAKTLLKSVGGKENIKDCYNCITRLRLEVNDSSLINEEQIKATSVAGVYRPSPNNIQIIIGPEVEKVYNEFEKLL
ncbi:PTS transporter subunit EIIC [uncultured Anaerococcus sp.]|mgnify:CR=1 FL=1|uniref:PTS transporter subunit EIIC n=1 Tax=uncultured Anaerococcus sp. TaxID=293428 RepID=UPI0025DBCF81|nr:PTS transporter subunit EIIC [uncultured Anaerococcus sp.]